MKIYIIGPSGSGKTTLSRQLSEILNHTHTDLDDLFWDNRKNAFGIKRDDSIRDEMYEDVLMQDSWIVEGAYLSWPSRGFRLADTLVYLDVKDHILAFRIIKRFLQRKLGMGDCKKKETLSGLVKLLNWNKEQAIKMKEHFDSGSYTNIIRLSTKRDICCFLEGFIA